MKGQSQYRVPRLYFYLHSGAESHHKSSVPQPGPQQSSVQGLSGPLTFIATSDRRPLIGSMCNHAGWLPMLSVLVISVLSAVLACHATPSPSPWDEMIIKHKWDAIPDNWVSQGQPPNGTTIKLHIALKGNHENALIDAFHEVSQPSHPKHVLFTSTPTLEAHSHVPLRCFRYGAHLSRDQVADLAAPHPDTLELVFSWLEYNGVPPSSISTTHGGSWLTIARVPVSKANKMLGASYELYCHAWTNGTILRTAGYALPAILHMHVKTIVPTTAFTSTRLLDRKSTRLNSSHSS